MKIFKKVSFFAALAISLAACTDVVDSSHVGPTVQVEEIGFSMSADVTRTGIEADGVTTRWAVGDRLAVWAKDEGGNYTFENTEFTLRYFSHEFDKAYFTSNIATMAEGEYTYYMSYPKPKSVEGTSATFSVSAEQSGAYDGKYDIMIAKPVVAEALTLSKKMELNTVMLHQMHALKITVPEKASNFDNRVYRLEVTFPNAVVGDITLDVTDPNAKPVYTNTSNTIVVKSDEGFAVGSDIWVFVLPGMVSGDVSYKIAGAEQRSEVATYPLERTMERGHVTPIRMAMPPFEKYTAFNFSIGENYLGEDFNFFTLYDSNGTNMGTYNRNAENLYTWEYYGEFDVTPYNNSNWTLVFDTENAVVENKVNMGALKPYFMQNITPVDVPYLLFQDFENVSGEQESNGNNSYQSSDRNQPGVELSGELAGWNGARFWIKPGAARINSRYQCTKVFKAFSSMHHGRLDTPTLGDCGLKPGKEPYVMVSFDAALNRNSSSSLELKEGAINLATHTNGSNPIDGIPTGATGLTSSYDTTLADFGTTYFTQMLANDAGDNVFGQVFPTYTTTDFRATSNTRLCFYPTLSPTSDKTGNIEINVYADNIRVWIAQ
jgi:hypothetical protein